MVRKFLLFRSERKKRTTSGGGLQFPNGFCGKLLFHLTFNRNFWIFSLNGKHPRCCLRIRPAKLLKLELLKLDLDCSVQIPPDKPLGHRASHQVNVGEIDFVKHFHHLICTQWTVLKHQCKKEAKIHSEL